MRFNAFLPAGYGIDTLVDPVSAALVVRFSSSGTPLVVLRPPRPAAAGGVTFPAPLAAGAAYPEGAARNGQRAGGAPAQDKEARDRVEKEVKTKLQA